VSLFKTSELPSVTVKVWLAATLLVSLLATGLSLIPIIVIVITAMSVPPFPSETV